MDIKNMQAKEHSRYMYILSTSDTYSKFLSAFPMKDQTSLSIVAAAK